MMIRAVLADGQLLDRQKLRQMLFDLQCVEVVGESQTASETLEVVQITRPDLLFLDLSVSGMNASNAVKQLSSNPDVIAPAVVFTTCDPTCALQPFQIHAADYLLKPFHVEHLRRAIDRAAQQIQSERAHRQDTDRHQPERDYTRRIAFKSRGRILFLPVSSIRWISAEENYVRICTESETHLLREPIGRLEEKLDPHMFRRVHRSSIVNLEFVKEVRTQGNGESIVILADGQKLAMSRSYRARMNQWLMNRQGVY